MSDIVRARRGRPRRSLEERFLDKVLIGDGCNATKQRGGRHDRHTIR